jgi:hypothetical protein
MYLRVRPLIGNVVSLTLLITVFSAPWSGAAEAAALSMRTYVSGTGGDGRSCITPAQACKTLGGALKKTAAGGQIFVLDAADYGPIIIDKAITITSPGGAGVLATNGIAITIKAGTEDVVNLNGLDIDGGKSGTIGIQFVSGRALNIQKTTVRDFKNAGISFGPNGAANLFVVDTLVTGNAGIGILIASGGSTVLNCVFNRVSASANGVGIFANGSGVNLTMTDTVTGNGSYGVGAILSAVMVRNSTVSNNAIGIAALSNSTVRVGQSTVTANGTSWTTADGGEVQSYGNNSVEGNTTDSTPTTTVALR